MRLAYLTAIACALLIGAAPSTLRGGTIAETPALFFDEPHAGTSDDDLAIMARRNALAFGVNTKQMAVLRAANPQLKVLLYEHPAGTNVGAKDYAYLDQRESWWVHDVRGSRMHEMGGGPWYAWLLNIGVPNYRTYTQNKILSTVIGSNYDGYFLDTSNPYWPIFRDWYDVNDRPTKPTDAILAGWPDWMLSFHQELKEMAGSFLHIFNSWPNNPERYQEYKYWLEATIDAVDGVQFDGFCYNRSQPWSTDSWEYQLAQGRRLLGRGKYVLFKAPMDGLRDDPVTLRRLQRFCFGSYLLVTDGTRGLFRNPDEADVVYWNERLFTAPVGSPLARFYKVGPIYRRDFANGAVVVNSSDVRQPVPLGGLFYTLGGRLVSALNLDPLDGEVLLLTPPP